jgi:LysM repeat protein
MRFRLYGLAYIMCIGSLLLCGCSENVGMLDARDSADATMRRARGKVSEGEPDAAIKLYQKVLNNDSRMARAHLDLALLLSDKNEYLDAICHYRRYLAMRPSTEKRGMIEKRMYRDIQLFIAAQTPDSSLRPTGRGSRKDKKDFVSGNKFATTLQKLKQAEDNEKELKEIVAELKKENKKLANKVGDCESELDQYRAVVGLTPRNEVKKKPVVKPEPAPDKKEHRTYRVRRGDTLSSIAADVYGDEKQWHKIQKANKDKLKGRQKINTGEILIIP